MWIGHTAPALIARTFLPHVPLSVLFFGCASSDFVAFVLSLLGIETFQFNPSKHGALPYDFIMPYSHSLVCMTAWAVLYAAVCGAMVRSGMLHTQLKSNAAKRSWLQIELPIALMVVSHWALEVPVHRTLRDGVKIWPHSLGAGYGWGWYSEQVFANVLELGLFFGAFLVYMYRTVPAQANSTRQSALDTPTTFVAACTASQLFVCAAPHWFYAAAPESIVMLNGLALMAFESFLAHRMDSQRVAPASVPR